MLGGTFYVAARCTGLPRSAPAGVPLASVTTNSRRLQFKYSVYGRERPLTAKPKYHRFNPSHPLTALLFSGMVVENVFVDIASSLFIVEKLGLFHGVEVVLNLLWGKESSNLCGKRR